MNLRIRNVARLVGQTFLSVRPGRQECLPYHCFIALLWICSVTCAAWSAEEVAATNGAGASAFLIVDYIPPAIYEGDGLSVCLRIENVFAANNAFEVSAKAFTAAGEKAKDTSENATLKRGAFGAVKLEFDARRVAKIELELRHAGQPSALGAQAIVLVRDDDVWPKTKFVNGRLVHADSGAIVLPVVQKKRAVEDRAFAPLKWLFGSSDEQALGGGKSIAFAPNSWAANTPGIHVLGLWPADGSIPLLNATRQILDDIGAAKSGEIKRVAILLPPEDLELATDPRVYRVTLDALVARLTKSGVISIVLIAPFRYGCNDAHRKAIWREIHDSAANNSIRAQDPLDWMSEEKWRADPATPKVYASRPNAAGRKMIEQALANLIR